MSHEPDAPAAASSPAASPHEEPVATAAADAAAPPSASPVFDVLRAVLARIGDLLPGDRPAVLAIVVIAALAAGVLGLMTQVPSPRALVAFFLVFVLVAACTLLLLRRGMMVAIVLIFGLAGAAMIPRAELGDWVETPAAGGTADELEVSGTVIRQSLLASLAQALLGSGDSEPAIGATVSVTGAGASTPTDSAGNFSLRVPRYAARSGIRVQVWPGRAPIRGRTFEKAPGDIPLHLPVRPAGPFPAMVLGRGGENPASTVRLAGFGVSGGSLPAGAWSAATDLRVILDSVRVVDNPERNPGPWTFVVGIDGALRQLERKLQVDASSPGLLQFVGNEIVLQASADATLRIGVAPAAASSTKDGPMHAVSVSPLPLYTPIRFDMDVWTGDPSAPVRFRFSFTLVRMTV